jgi:hypothetical protein
MNSDQRQTCSLFLYSYIISLIEILSCTYIPFNGEDYIYGGVMKRKGSTSINSMPIPQTIGLEPEPEQNPVYYD